MSICSYNTKNQKSNPSNTPTNSTTKTLKDERPGSHFPSKGPARRQQTSFEHKKGYGASSRNRNWKNQRLDNSKNDQRFEKYASGSSFVTADGKVNNGSKKGSGNHLLSVYFEPRPCEVARQLQWSTSKCYGNRSTPLFKKDRFLQANGRFITKEGADYLHNSDPDAPIPWGNVEKVLLLVDKGLSCPICMCPPAVPKITKCGHLYCWSCILHYLALDERGKSVRDCPICGIYVHKADLRSCGLFEPLPLQIGGGVKMNLMFRKSTSLTPKPIAEMDGYLEVNGSSKGIPKFEEYSPLQILECIVNPELDMLKAQLTVELDELEQGFINCAIADCENRQKDLLSQISSEDKARSNKAMESVPNRDEEFGMEAEMCSVRLKNSRDDDDGSRCYYFYQIEGGQNIFLDGINIKCLLKEFGNFKNCPPVIEAPLLHFENFVMTEELRKRHKYLSHLPLSCRYKIAELDLRSPLLSQETLGEFQEMITRRAKIRQHKERLENESKKRAEVAEQRKFEALCDNTFTYNKSEIVARPASNSIKISPDATDFPVGSPTSETSDMSVSPPAGSMSFAEKLRTGEASTSVRTSEVKMTTAKSNPPMSNQIMVDGSDDDDDPSYHAPAYQFSFVVGLNASVLDGIKSKSPDVAEAQQTENSGGRKRKNKKMKKKKQQLLFSTSAHMRT